MINKKAVKECNGLSVGDKVNDFRGIDQHGNKIQLSDLLKKGKVVLVFYRGQWCPICMPHLRKLQEDFDVAFLPSMGLRFVYNTMLRANLKNAQSDDSQTLPVPATFIIDTNSKVKWRHFDRDYKKRSKINDILENL